MSTNNIPTRMRRRLDDPTTCTDGSTTREEVTNFLRSHYRDNLNAVFIPDQGLEPSKTHPKLATLGKQFETLPDQDRVYKGIIRTWEEVVAAIPNMPDFLDALDHLQDPRCYFISNTGQLIVGDSKPRSAMNFADAEDTAARISYIEFEGGSTIVVRDNRSLWLTPESAKKFSLAGLVSYDEWLQANRRGEITNDKLVWVTKVPPGRLSHGVREAARKCQTFASWESRSQRIYFSQSDHGCSQGVIYPVFVVRIYLNPL